MNTSNLVMTEQTCMPAEPNQQQVIRLQIRGRVQGVYYRASMVDEARRLGATGWVRNRLDGSVEAMACGTHAQLNALVKWAWQGPPAAAVSDVGITPGEGEFIVFVQRSTI